MAFDPSFTYSGESQVGFEWKGEELDLQKTAADYSFNPSEQVGRCATATENVKIVKIYFLSLVVTYPSLFVVPLESPQSAHETKSLTPSACLPLTIGIPGNHWQSIWNGMRYSSDLMRFHVLSRWNCFASQRWKNSWSLPSPRRIVS